METVTRRIDTMPPSSKHNHIAAMVNAVEAYEAARHTRDEAIAEASIYGGLTRRTVGEIVGLSAGRVQQIVQAYVAEHGEEIAMWENEQARLELEAERRASRYA